MKARQQGSWWHVPLEPSFPRPPSEASTWHGPWPNGSRPATLDGAPHLGASFSPATGVMRGGPRPPKFAWSLPTWRSRLVDTEKKQILGGLVLPIMHTKTSRTQVWCKIWQPFLLGKSSVTKNIQKSFHFEVMLWKWISFPPFQCDLAYLVLSPNKKVHHQETSASFHHRWHWDQSSHSGSASCSSQCL